MNPLRELVLMRCTLEYTAAVTFAGLGSGCHENSRRHVAEAGEQ